jgi:hypothetical protein
MEELIAISYPNHTNRLGARLTQENYVLDDEFLNLRVTNQVILFDDLDRKSL